ncbi:VRR-NUC domain-containing protein [Desulfuromonas thiophila]|uniref:VRR-NUC domain-containing protein n=1 Tax=Desulfuromonas thiophila TaxID=57664 RepID=A0A1G7B2R4_9BACT|nr:VRR-NUC domain-containing protein [Desulfuromonas thiophila]SDE21232.1 VRR-NUC domain-containing protein [Desulfuromonas thiophila]
MKNQTPLESWEQEQFFRWVISNQIRIPELQLANGSMNGIRVSPSLRARLKGQGLRPGVPDIDLPVRRGECCGLRIEMKRKAGGTVSAEQKRFHELLRSQGYRVEVCRGWREAVAVVRDYLGV